MDYWRFDYEGCSLPTPSLAAARGRREVPQSPSPALNQSRVRHASALLKNPLPKSIENMWKNFWRYSFAGIANANFNLIVERHDLDLDRPLLGVNFMALDKRFHTTCWILSGSPAICYGIRSPTRSVRTPLAAALGDMDSIAASMITERSIPSKVLRHAECRAYHWKIDQPSSLPCSHLPARSFSPSITGGISQSVTLATLLESIRTRFVNWLLTS